MPKKERRCIEMSDIKIIDGKPCRLVYCKSIRKNGKTIYPKKGKVFRFWVPVEAA